MGDWKKVFITVKTYPHPSNTYGELVCTAGIDESGQFVRLYPLKYRQLSGEEQFSKYQWINVEVEKNPKDVRPESYHAAQSTLKALESVKYWKERRALVLGDRKLATMCELTEDTHRLNRSLGIVKPKEILDFIAVPDDEDWSPEQRESLRQTLLWDSGGVPPLRKVPYKFYYQYKCHSSGCKGHRQSVYDWELFVLYLKMLEKEKSPDMALVKVRQKFFDELCSAQKDLHFFVGTHVQYPAWIIIGVFYPPNPHPPEKKGQMTLWSIFEK